MGVRDIGVLFSTAVVVQFYVIFNVEHVIM